MNLLSGVDESEEIRKNLLAKSFTGNILKSFTGNILVPQIYVLGKERF